MFNNTVWNIVPLTKALYHCTTHPSSSCVDTSTLSETVPQSMTTCTRIALSHSPTLARRPTTSRIPTVPPARSRPPTPHAILFRNAPASPSHVSSLCSLPPLAPGTVVTVLRAGQLEGVDRELWDVASSKSRATRYLLQTTRSKFHARGRCEHILLGIARIENVSPLLF